MNNPLTLSLMALALAWNAYASEPHAPHWDYDAHGPAHWCDFSAVCSNGKAQSPIDIRTDATAPISSANVILLNENVITRAEIVDNGHAVQVNVDNGGKISVGGVDYQLVQFHFHGKSEEKIDGKQYDLVAHMVHKSAFGNLLVVGVLFEEGKERSAILDTVTKGVGSTTLLNPAALLPRESGRYWHYMGSLTTPPCSENVRWYVMKEIQSATAEQIAAMRKFYDHNYRPVQPLNGRIVESK